MTHIRLVPGAFRDPEGILESNQAHRAFLAVFMELVPEAYDELVAGNLSEYDSLKDRYGYFDFEAASQHVEQWMGKYQVTSDWLFEAAYATLETPCSLWDPYPVSLGHPKLPSNKAVQVWDLYDRSLTRGHNLPSTGPLADEDFESEGFVSVGNRAGKSLDHFRWFVRNRCLGESFEAIGKSIEPNSASIADTVKCKCQMIATLIDTHRPVGRPKSS